MQGLGFRVQSLGFKGLRVEGLEFTQRLRKLGQLGCHQLDELLSPKLRSEALEVRDDVAHHLFVSIGQGLHCCRVVAHEVEQSAHLPLGLLRSPACLRRAEGSESAGVFTRTRWKL